MNRSYGPYRGIVDNVHDGDTVYVKLDVGFDLTVYARCRIAGINAPELSTAEGKIAREFASKALPVGTEVMVTSQGWDKYGGRIDAVLTLVHPMVYMGLTYTNFGLLMLEAGQAVKYDGG
jgi:endonuclease YncB( thermonuclease family)